MVDKVKILHGEARTVLACDLLQRVDAFLQKGDDSTRKALKEEMNGALKEEMETIRIRGAEFKETMEAKVGSSNAIFDGHIPCLLSLSFSRVASCWHGLRLMESGSSHKACLV